MKESKELQNNDKLAAAFDKVSNEGEFRNALSIMLSDARSESSYSQTDIAKIIGCSREHISHCENGKSAFTAYDLYVYCKLFDLSASDLFENGDGHTKELSIPSTMTDLEAKLVLLMVDAISKASDDDRLTHNIIKLLSTQS